VSAKPLIELRSVKKSYGSLEVIKNASLSIKEGDFVGVFGPSGSGKTTLLHLMGGLETPTAGEVHLLGKRIDTLGERERDRLRRGRVAFIFQQPNLLEDFTVEENLEIFAELAGADRSKVPLVLRFLGLENRRRFKPALLSGGERQRVALGRALASGARIILADEPTGSLDRERSEEIFKLFEVLNRRGYTFVVVTHDLFFKGRFKKIYSVRGGFLSDKLPV